MRTDDYQFVIRAPIGALFIPLLLLGLAGAALYFGGKTLPQAADSPEYAALIPVGGLLILASVLLYRSSRRPLILDKNANRILGYPQELSKAQKVVVVEVGSGSDASYVVELVFPDGNFRLSRAGWSYEQSSHGPDQIAKKIGAFLGIPVETKMPFYASFSFSKGFYLTKKQAEAAEKAGYKVDPDAIK